MSLMLCFLVKINMLLIVDNWLNMHTIPYVDTEYFNKISFREDPIEKFCRYLKEAS